MKIFLIIYVFGRVGATAGPLPYDYAECMRRALEMQAGYEQAVLAGEVSAGSMQFTCQMLFKAPDVDELS